VTARNFQKRLSENFTIKLHGKALTAAELYILRKIEIAVNKGTENFAVFLTRTNVNFQKGITLKMDMKEVSSSSVFFDQVVRVYDLTVKNLTQYLQVQKL